MNKYAAAVCLSLLAAGLAAHADEHFSYTPPKDYPSIAAIRNGGGCAPKDNMARILKSPHPLDYAPDWSGNNYIGTGWTFMPKRYVVDPDMQGSIYLQGNLITTRGGLLPRDVFVLYAEWDCAH